MFELRYRNVDISRHGYIEIALLIVPLEGKTAVEGDREINGHGVVGFDGDNEMIKVVFCCVFNSKIVHNNYEQYVAGSMTEEAVDMGHLGVTVGFEVDL